MYMNTKLLVGAAGGTTALAFTALNTAWYALGAITLLTVGGLVLRLVPRRAKA